MIEVLNKIDLLDEDSRRVLHARAERAMAQVPISALRGEGVDNLYAAIDAHLSSGKRTVTLAVNLADGAAIAWLYDHGQVVARRDDQEFAHLRVNIDPNDLARFRRRHTVHSGQVNA